jgi:hypothetical protein
MIISCCKKRSADETQTTDYVDEHLQVKLDEDDQAYLSNRSVSLEITLGPVSPLRCRRRRRRHHF